MKLTKPLIIAALVAGNLCAWDIALRAQSTNNTPPAGPRGGMRGGPGIDQLAQQLNLTDDQKTKVKPILDAQQQKMRDLRGDTSLSPDDRRAKMQGIRDETTTQMKAVLTPDQFEKWQTMMQRGRRPGGPPAGGANAGSTNAPATPPKQ
jgi:Spy/CpxP family protein refolding chaperone